MKYRVGEQGYDIAKYDDEFDKIFDRLKNKDDLSISNYKDLLNYRDKASGSIVENINGEIDKMKNMFLNKIESLEKQKSIFTLLLKYINKLEEINEINNYNYILSKLQSIEDNINKFNLLLNN